MSYVKSFLMAALLLSLSAPMRAADVDAVGAQALATEFLQSCNAGKLMSPGGISLRLAYTEQSPSRPGSADYYVFNSDRGDGFVIVAGDDRAEQILAYGEQALDMAALPPNLQWWLDQYKAQIEWLAEQAGVNVPSPKRAPDDDVVIAPLLKSIWHQDTPFNNQCPVINGESTATGCVATAMAMVMYFWKYPAELPPLPGYVTITEQYQVPALPGTQVDWDNMLDFYSSGGYSEEQGAAVATLLRYCGQSCYMDYTSMGSGAWQDEQLMGLKRFGYNREAQCLSRDDYDDGQWNEMIMEDLSNGRPVLYTGAGFGGAHAFVLDGYSGGRYHVNWGWGGGNGYYVLDALGSSDWQFNYYQTMQHHVYPDPEGAQAPLYDFEESGLCYHRVGDVVEVVRRDIMANCYSGSITVPETVTHDGETLTVAAIAPCAFMDCEGLTEVTLPTSVTCVGEGAFTNCTGLKTVRLEGRNKLMCRNVFADDRALSEVYVDDIEAWCSMDFATSASSPVSYGGMLYDKAGTPMTDVVVPSSAGKVKDYQFAFYERLHSIVIEDGITEIGNDAFKYCTGLTSASLPQSLQSIGLEAFYYCEQLTGLSLPRSLQSIGDYAFNGCERLTQVDIPGSVTKLNDGSFCECYNLAQVTLNPGLEHVGDYAFYDCLSLDSVALPGTVTRLGYAAFCGSGLTGVSLNEGLQQIEDYAFYGCYGLQQITVPASVSLIGSGAFTECSSLGSVVLKGAPDRIGEHAFKSCNQLSHVEASDVASWCHISFGDNQANPLFFARHLHVGGKEVCDLKVPAGVTSINDYAFIQCEGLTSLTMGGGVESIGEQAFLGCKQMTVATVGNGVRTVGEKAFNGCRSLQAVTLGSRVESVGMYVFGGCNALQTITSRAVTPPYLRGKTSFADKVYNNAVVRVPRESVDAYREALVWKHFTNIQGVNFLAEAADVNGDGEVTIADVNLIIDAIILGGTSAWPVDVNGDDDVSVADINAVVNIILTGQ